MSERRYSRDEVAVIFEGATRAEQRGMQPRAPGEGMTLAELQEIGREVGVAPELVARAAAALDRAGHHTDRRLLGMPLGVGLNVTLGRHLSDAEWERLVVDLRTTFDAKGVVRQDGNLRQWSNGNLHVLLEPAEHGHRVRFRTLNGTSRSLVAAGGAMLASGALLLIVAAAEGAGLGALVPGAGVGLFGVGFLASGLLRLPAWAARRRQQMEEIAARLVGRTGVE